jgi:hypothetical protein
MQKGGMMHKLVWVLVFAVLGGTVYAGGTMDASVVSPEDIKKMETIVQALDPEVAIQTTLTSFSRESLSDGRLSRYSKNKN